MHDSTVGKFGDGFTHGNFVSSAHCERFQFGALTTIRLQPMPNRSLAICAHSPIDRPWRMGMRYMPTNVENFGSSRFPSTISPPIGFGRSNTTNGMLFSFAAFMPLAMVAG